MQSELGLRECRRACAVTVAISLAFALGCHGGSPPNAKTVGGQAAPDAAKPMWITGNVTLENGQPTPKYLVKAGGFSGSFDLRPNGTALGQPEGATAFRGGAVGGSVTGVNGPYAIHMDNDAAITSVRAYAEFQFDNQVFEMDAFPTDNIPDGDGYPATNDLYRGQVSKGVVRDFVVKMSGIRPGYDPAQVPDHEVSQQTTACMQAFYGASVGFNCSKDSTVEGPGGLTKVYPAGSIFTVTFTPTGSRVDGSPASVITRACPMADSFFLYDIPVALYSVSVSLAEPGGAVHNLKILDTAPPEHYFNPNTGGVWPCPSCPAAWKTSAPIRWMSGGNVGIRLPQAALFVGEE